MAFSIKDYITQTILFVATSFTFMPALATSLPSFNPQYGHLIFQLGGFSASQGNNQHIGIQGLIGDQFTLTDHTDENVLLGIGYFIDGKQINSFTLFYGINAFYLAPTQVHGNIIQENLFTNLSYRYSITNWPIYLSAKTYLYISETGDVTFDVGVGPNIIHTSHFKESSLDGGISIPERAFTGQTNVAFSATFGMGLKFNRLLGKLPLEIGYRFFYLGRGYLNKTSNQFTGDLNTGSSYANALIVSTSFC